jgi:hypothetical protein
MGKAVFAIQAQRAGTKNQPSRSLRDRVVLSNPTQD